MSDSTEKSRRTQDKTRPQDATAEDRAEAWAAGDKVQALLAELEAKVAELKAIEQEYRNSIKQTAIDSIVNAGFPKAVASVLYWYCDHPVVRDGIMQALDIKHRNQIGAAVFANISRASCVDCGRTVEYVATSRAAADIETCVCDECKAIRREQLNASAKAHNDRIRLLRAMPYREYLKTDHWKATRNAALKRAGFRCQVCNNGNVTLNVHHRTYENRGNELSRDLIVLCQHCHQTFHDTGKLAGGES